MREIQLQENPEAPVKKKHRTTAFELATEG
jgi:hypothetical protein